MNKKIDYEKRIGDGERVLGGSLVCEEDGDVLNEAMDVVAHRSFFFSSRRRHTRLQGDWSSDVCSSDLGEQRIPALRRGIGARRAHRRRVQAGGGQGRSRHPGRRPDDRLPHLLSCAGAPRCDAKSGEMNAVLLAGGLWMPGMAMALLGARLGRDGYSAHVFHYSGRESLEGNIERLVRYARAHGRVHLVGHSLGGVLVFDALERHPELDVATAVLIGAPVRGCLAGRRLAVSRLGRWVIGATAPRWGERNATWRRPEPLGIIARTLPLRLGWMTGRLPGQIGRAHV